jgi:hypothetical protein
MNLTRGLEEAHNSMSQKILPLHWVHASKPIRAYKKGKSISAQLEQAMLKDLVAVTFRKGVTPWLPFRRLESMVAPDWIPGLLVAC